MFVYLKSVLYYAETQARHGKKVNKYVIDFILLYQCFHKALGFCRSIGKKKKDPTETTAVVEEEESKAKRTSKMEVKLLSGQTVFYGVSGKSSYILNPICPTLSFIFSD